MAVGRQKATKSMAMVSVLVLLLGGLATAIPSSVAQTVEDASFAEIEPLDVGLVIDRSGSMVGEPSMPPNKVPSGSSRT